MLETLQTKDYWTIALGLFGSIATVFKIIDFFKQAELKARFITLVHNPMNSYPEGPEGPLLKETTYALRLNLISLHKEISIKDFRIKVVFGEKKKEVFNAKILAPRCIEFRIMGVKRYFTSSNIRLLSSEVIIPSDSPSDIYVLCSIPKSTVEVPAYFILEIDDFKSSTGSQVVYLYPPEDVVNVIDEDVFTWDAPREMEEFIKQQQALVPSSE